jgi:hypothetical protein
MERSVPAFLTGAGADHYLACGSWSDGDVATHWSPLADKPLGAPLADAVYDAASGLWTRAFESGTTVVLDAATGAGNVTWSTGEVLVVSHTGDVQVLPAVTKE